MIGVGILGIIEHCLMRGLQAEKSGFRMGSISARDKAMDGAERYEHQRSADRFERRSARTDQQRL